MGQIRKETLRHEEAFQLYCTLGARRSYNQVAHRTGISSNSINKWARSFDWKRRVEEHDSTPKSSIQMPSALRIAERQGVESD